MHYSLHFRYVHPARRPGVVASEDEVFPNTTEYTGAPRAAALTPRSTVFVRTKRLHSRPQHGPAVGDA